MPQERAPRNEAIDQLRGAIMVIMALDHVRDYFGHNLYDATDLDKTYPALFATRWITHFCAPVFVFLAGVAAALSAGRGRAGLDLTRFLAVRGAILILLELTVVRFGWFFDLTYRLSVLQVIWAIGVSMLVLSVLVLLPRWVALAVAVVMILGHDLLDGVHVDGEGPAAFGWSLLHEFHPFTFGGGRFTLVVVYPLIPWIGVMALGYVVGPRAALPRPERRRFFARLGAALAVAFVVLRATNLYGDVSQWSARPSALFTLFSFVNVSKYPPSLLYCLMTLGPACLALAALDTERPAGAFRRVLAAYGVVPLFYYIVHLYVLHAGARALAAVLGRPFEVTFGEGGVGLPLAGVYVAWLVVVAILYVPCVRYAALKARHPRSLLRFI